MNFQVQKHRSAVAGKAEPVSNFLSTTMAMAGLEPDDDDKKLEDCSHGSDFDTEQDTEYQYRSGPRAQVALSVEELKDSERESKLKKPEQVKEEEAEQPDDIDKPWHFEGSDSAGTVGDGQRYFKGSFFSNEKRNPSVGGSSGDLASGSIRNGGGIPCLREKRKLGKDPAI